MKTWLNIALVLISGIVLAATPQLIDVRDLIGTWEGESRCTIPTSPCTNEHVIYKIAADKSGIGKARLDTFKIVNGKQELVGTLDCTYRAGEILDCTSNSSKTDRREFRVAHDRMIGSLVVGDNRTLYRRLGLRKK
jgi:hypothetical protein